MAAKTEPDPKADPPADPPAGKGTAVDERMDRIEATQAEQGGMLKTILDRLPGKAPDRPTAPDGPSSGSSDPTDIQGTVRREIAEAEERRKAEAKAKGDEDWRKSVDEALEVVKAEKAPREPQTGVKGRLQRAMFGGDQ